LIQKEDLLEEVENTKANTAINKPKTTASLVIKGAFSSIVFFCLTYNNTTKARNFKTW
jgi:hypothetical protein